MKGIGRGQPCEPPPGAAEPFVAQSTVRRGALSGREIGAGGIGSTLQIGSTPQRILCSSMNSIIPGRRSSSAPKKAAAALRISLARRSSLFSFSRPRSRSRSSVLRPGRRPSSRSAWRTHWRKVSRFRSGWHGSILPTSGASTKPRAVHHLMCDKSST